MAHHDTRHVTTQRRRARGIVTAWIATCAFGALLGFVAGRTWPWQWRLWRTPPQVAIVIDDCGYHDTTMPLLQTIDRPLTLAILPHLAHSREIAEFGEGHHFEIMLHLPMEPEGDHTPTQRWEASTLTTRMSRQEIQRRLAGALESVPHARGINNHMGSKATTNATLMRSVLEELKARELYFVDSLVTPKSVADRLAAQVGVRFAERAVFLDNRADAAYIRRQLRELVAEAKQRGRAIGIGHDRSTTLRVIRDMVPEIEAAGVRLVYASAVVE